ncbi:hypothetical protein pb186bvf_006279 [Paramecium bursaria]
MRIVQDNTFFKEKSQLFDNHLYNQLIRKINIQHYHKGEVVFHYGSLDLSLIYIIYQGQVGILCPKTPDLDPELPLQDYNRGLIRNKLSLVVPPRDFSNSPVSSPRLSRSKRFKLPESSFKEQIRTQAIQDIVGEWQQNSQQYKSDAWMELQMRRLFPNLKMVNLLIAGESFGERGVINQVHRSATVFTMSDTYLITLTNDDFQQIFEQYQEQLQEKKMNLLKGFEQFKNYSNRRLERILESTIIQKFSMHSVIYYENTPADYLYFIKSGDVEIQKLIGNKKTLSITILSAAGIFGYEEIIHQKPREYRAVAKSSCCELYLVPQAFIKASECKNYDEKPSYHAQRLVQLLKQKPLLQTKLQKMPRNSIEFDWFKEMFSTDVKSVTRLGQQKIRLSKQHKKIMSDSTRQLYDMELIKNPSDSPSTRRLQTYQYPNTQSPSLTPRSPNKSPKFQLNLKTLSEEKSNMHICQTTRISPRVSMKFIKTHRPYLKFKFSM